MLRLISDVTESGERAQTRLITQMILQAHTEGDDEVPRPARVGRVRAAELTNLHCEIPTHVHQRALQFTRLPPPVVRHIDPEPYE